ncbi:hypothetical protein GCM10027080_05340 [Pedococcus soli]
MSSTKVRKAGVRPLLRRFGAGATRGAAEVAVAALAEVVAELVEVRRVVSWFEANVSPWHSARFGAVRLLANEVPGPGQPTTVGPVPTLRPELDLLHRLASPNAERVLRVTADGTTHPTPGKEGSRRVTQS